MRFGGRPPPPPLLPLAEPPVGDPTPNVLRLAPEAAGVVKVELGPPWEPFCVCVVVD